MKIQALIRLTIFATQASSKEPVGPTLGQFGIPMSDFCNKFNTYTQKYILEAPLKVLIFSYGNQKYDFLVRYPSRIFFIFRCFKIEDIESYLLEKTLVLDKEQEKEKEERDKERKRLMTVNFPGYLVFPMTKLFYLTPYMLYEILDYYYEDEIKRYFFKSEYKKFMHSLKSTGFLIFSY